MPATNAAVSFDGSVFESEEGTYDEKNVNTSLNKEMDAFFKALAKGEALGLPLIVKAVTNLAEHKNATPASALYSRFKQRGQGEEAIFGLYLRAFFGEKIVKVKKSDNANMPYKITADGFVKGVKPRNSWGLIVEAVEAGKAFNSKSLIKKLREELSPKVNPTDEAKKETARKAVVAAAKKGARDHMTLAEVIAEATKAYNEAA